MASEEFENHVVLAAEQSPTAAHTPGPWTNDENSTFVWSKAGNVCSCGDPHAQTTVGYTECDIGTPSLSEAVANARLIAAAPDTAQEVERLRALNADMLAALEPFARMADQVAERQKGYDPRVNLSFAADDLRRARAAIAKATGDA